MKYRQYFVVAILVFGCSKAPVPSDSYFITNDSYSSDTIVDFENTGSEQIDTTLFVSFSDTSQINSDSIFINDSILALNDTLELIEDSLFLSSDSVIAILDIPQNWHYIEIEIQGSLYQSLAVVTDVQSDILGAHCVRNLVWEMNPWRSFIAGDTLKVVYTTEELVRENMVIAFEYIPVTGSANHSFAGFVFQKSGDNWPSMWKSDGTELVKLLDRMPVQTFEEITSVFGEPRGSHTHAGVDYKAPEGTSVFSVTGGTVLRTNWNTAYNGNCIEIDFGGYSEIFLHLKDIEQGVVAGATIVAGQKIGSIGNTGISTASHLHYQINGPDGYAIDPYLYFSNHRRTLAEEDMASFSAFVQLCLDYMENSL